jgi:hypothetical protein
MTLYDFIYIVIDVNIGHGHMRNGVHLHGFSSINS